MIIDKMEKGKANISFEVFPPKKDEEFDGMYATLDKMALLKPDFISCTYGAGGSRAGKTVEISSYIQNKLGIETLAHMTCVGNSKEDIDKVCDDLKKEGITQILALRGDRPSWMSDEQFESRAFKHANELITYIKDKDEGFHFAGACYPEKHFEAMSKRGDLSRLKDKVNSGCDFLITQLFLDNDRFYEFAENCLAAGITVPILAGIMPITSIKQVATSISLSGTSVPKVFSDIIARYRDNPEDMRKAGIDYAIRQINDLKDNGADGIHIYSMNKPKMTAEIMDGIK